MRVISPLLKRIVYPGLAAAGYFRTLRRTGPVVITYHGVAPEGYRSLDPALDGALVTRDALRRQIRLLQQHYCLITPEEFRKALSSNDPLPSRSVLLTCDDGLKNTVTDMLPVLQETGASCLFFALGQAVQSEPSLLWYEELYLILLHAPDLSRLNAPEFALQYGPRTLRTLWWDLVRVLSTHDSHSRARLTEIIRSQLGGAAQMLHEDDSSQRRFLLANCGELKQLVAAGMSIGAHSICHPILSACAPDVNRKEIEGSREILSAALNVPVWAFAYPFGDDESVGTREVNAARAAGYDCAFVNHDDNAGAEFDRFAIPRIHVTSDMSLAEFEAHLSGFYRALRRRFLPARSAGEQTLSAARGAS